MTSSVVTTTVSRDFRPSKQGKVRDLYDLGDTLVIVATDRLSAFDVVLPDGIPEKGRVLTQISEFWFKRLAEFTPHHLLSTDLRDFPEPFRSVPEIFAGRSMLVRKTEPIPVECVVRGYLSGSGWSEYRDTASVCGIHLPSGLRESERLEKAIFTPTTKAEVGIHDEGISFDEVRKLAGEETARKLRDLSIELYERGAEFAAGRGILIADTKFEFGIDKASGLLLIDEVLTPDSSRFWPMDQYAPGGPQKSFDKQFVRDYLISVRWDRKPPAPRLPGEVIETTSRKYREALKRLTGKDVA
jgi:phosphoribosylaminoimidazole-succinocarboxamide synthase